MQAPVSDAYAVGLARSFYAHLARRENFLASRALADARKEEERRRLDAARRGAPAAETQPEYATAALYVAGEERPMADFALDQRPLQRRPVHDIAGPVPQLRIDDLIGRRRELRETLRTLRDPKRQHAGVVLTGIGGVGKSAVAGRVMCRLAEDGWLIAVPEPGRLDLRAIAFALGAVLRVSGSEGVRKRGEDLVRADLDDNLRLHAVAQTLAEDRVLLVLDDFERTLTTGGEAFLDPDAAEILRQLARGARAGRLLITCRYPVPGSEAWLRRIPIGPLSPAESRKLRLRLPALAASEVGDDALLRGIGGHPRMLELLDGLLRGGTGRWPAVTEKLHRLAEEEHIDLEAAGGGLASAMQTALTLGARDILLGELLTLAREAGIAEVLLQAAVSNLPVTPAGLARMLWDDGAGDVAAVTAAARGWKRCRCCIVFPTARCSCIAGPRRGSPVSANRRPTTTAASAPVATGCGALSTKATPSRTASRPCATFSPAATSMPPRPSRAGCSMRCGISGSPSPSLGWPGEILESLPENHDGYAAIADEEAQAHLALGQTGRAMSRYQQLLRRQEKLAQAEPDRADYQRDLSVSYDRMGDLFRALGQGEEARQAYRKSLAISERLSRSRARPRRLPARPLGFLRPHGRPLSRPRSGQGGARRLSKSLGISERLAQAEPDRADYQRDLSVSYDRWATSSAPSVRARRHDKPISNP